MVSRLMTVGDDEVDEDVDGGGTGVDNEHEQWAREVIVLNSENRIGMCIEEEEEEEEGGGWSEERSC